MVNIYGEDTPEQRIQTLNAVKALMTVKERKNVLETALDNNELVKMVESLPSGERI